MQITAGMVKELREQTGAGMMDCKKALSECDGDMTAAAEYLRKKGVATAAKKANRIAAEGMTTVLVAEDAKSASIVEVNSETDFLAKNEMFQSFVVEVAKQALQDDCGGDMDAFMAKAWINDASQTVNDALIGQVAVLKENLKIRRVKKLETEGVIASYIHGGGRISVLVDMACSEVNDAVKQIAKEIAMQVAAMNPQYNTREDIDQEFIAKEKEILLEQAQKENDESAKPKPANVVEKMVEGRLNKELKEYCLIDQVFQIGGDGKESVGQYLERRGKELGQSLKVAGYVRFETGEGLEKKQENFAEEVAKQMA